MSNFREPNLMSPAELTGCLRDRLKRRRSGNEVIYYTFHDAAIDEAVLNEINRLEIAYDGALTTWAESRERHIAAEARISALEAAEKEP